MMKELDSIVLAVDLPAHRLKKGDVGTIVHVVTPDDQDLVRAAGFRQVSEFDDPDHRTLVYLRAAFAGVPAVQSAA